MESQRMCEVVCQYKDKCISFPNWCSSCKNNTAKKNYYVPDYQPDIPYYPPPCYPIWVVTTSGSTNSNYYCRSAP